MIWIPEIFLYFCSAQPLFLFNRSVCLLMHSSSICSFCIASSSFRVQTPVCIVNLHFHLIPFVSQSKLNLPRIFLWKPSFFPCNLLVHRFIIPHNSSLFPVHFEQKEVLEISLSWSTRVIYGIALLLVKTITAVRLVFFKLVPQNA